MFHEYVTHQLDIAPISDLTTVQKILPYFTYMLFKSLSSL